MYNRLLNRVFSIVIQTIVFSCLEAWVCLQNQGCSVCLYIVIWFYYPTYIIYKEKFTFFMNMLQFFNPTFLKAYILFINQSWSVFLKISQFIGFLFVRPETSSTFNSGFRTDYWTSRVHAEKHLSQNLKSRKKRLCFPELSLIFRGEFSVQVAVFFQFPVCIFFNTVYL